MKALVRCNTFGSLDSYRYRGPSGTTYIFEKAAPTEIRKEEDLKHFLNSGDGQSFTRMDTLKETAKKVVDKLTGESEKKKLTYDQLKAMNAKDQTALIKKMAGSYRSVPRLEEDKIKLILKIQG